MDQKTKIKHFKDATKVGETQIFVEKCTVFVLLDKRPFVTNCGIVDTDSGSVGHAVSLCQC